MAKSKKGSVLVVGGGIGGIQTSLDLADQDFKVFLVERGQSIGGKMVQLDKTFPTNDCAMCMISPKLVACARHPNIEILTMTEVQGVEGAPGRFKVRVREEPRSVDRDKCTGCGTCMAECPVRNVVVLPPAAAPPAPLAAGDEAFLGPVLEEFSGQPGALLPVLQRANSHYRYLPRLVIEHISHRMQIPVSLILRVATFYNSFNLVPVGRHVAEICTGTACHVRGSARLAEVFSNHIGIHPGGTTADMRFTFKTVNCIGCCALAPAVRVDGKVFAQVKPSQIPAITADFK
jgi:heterodisulfide reductase subunit A